MGKIFYRSEHTFIKPQMGPAAVPLSQVLLHQSALLGVGVGGQALETLSHVSATLTKQDRKPPPPVIARWLKTIEDIVRLAQSSGAPIAPILRECAKFIKSDERMLRRATGVKAQFALQAAILIVAPWVVVLFAGGPNVNPALYVGLVFQALGVVFFTLLTRKLVHRPPLESDSLRFFLINLWLRVQSGQDITYALSLSVSAAFSEDERLRVCWQSWSEGLRQTSARVYFQWPRAYILSGRLAEGLEPLFSSGAPIAQYALSYAEQLEADRAAHWEDELASAPTKLSLILCLFFAPALMALLVSTLWNELTLISL